MPLLASDIARRLRQPGEDPVRVLNRIRNWTKFGLLTPAGEAHPGGGRACQYSDATLLDAMIIQELVNAGIPAVSVGSVLEQIKSDAPQLFGASFTKLHDRTLLILGKAYSGSNAINVWLRSPTGFAKLAEKQSRCSLYYVIDIEKLRDRLNAEPEGESE